jgi:hypothetical protein
VGRCNPPDLRLCGESMIGGAAPYCGTSVMSTSLGYSLAVVARAGETEHIRLARASRRRLSDFRMSECSLARCAGLGGLGGAGPRRRFIRSGSRPEG